MKIIKNKLKKFKRDGHISTDLLDVESTVVKSIRIESHNSILSIHLYIDVRTANKMIKSPSSLNDEKNITMTDAFGMNKIYKYSFTLLRQNTNYSKEEISSILKEDSSISTSQYNENDIRIIIPILEKNIDPV